MPALFAIAIGVDRTAYRMLREALPMVEFREVPMDISKLLKGDGEAEPDLIFCGRPLGSIDLVEIALGIRSVYAQAPMYYVCTEREGFDQQALSKNGFADAFLLPLDKSVVRNLVTDNSADYKDVPLINLTPDTVLDFDTYVFLPINRKFIRYSSAGSPLSDARSKRLLDHEIRVIYVPVEQLAAYSRFTTNQLKKIKTGDGLGPIERKEMMQKAVRSLLSGFLTENATIQDYNEIVKTYIIETSPEPDSIYERMLNFSNSGGDAYSHVTNASSLAALLSLGLGIGKVEEIALAGLLHDIGLADVAIENQEKHDSERTEAERLAYQQHPLIALQIIKKRQIELSTRVLKIIEQHHERWDARGFPNEVRGADFMAESQLVAIADELEYATQMRAGKNRVSLRVAVEKLMQSKAYDPALLAIIGDLLGVKPQ